jgi:hypothetical protein
MSVRKQKYHRKGKRVLAQFRPGKITKTRSFNLDHHQYVYLIHIVLDDEPDIEYKFMPQDVEELTVEKL